MQNIDWFHNLNSPWLSPPDWIFMPMWIILYITMAISFILFLKSGLTKSKIVPLLFFGAQLFLNIMWTIIFFNWQNIFLAFVDVVLLLVAILITMLLFFNHSKASAYWLIPYFIWVMFATYLNFGYLILN